MEEDSYLKQKLRSSICFSCCFGARDRREEEIEVEQPDEQPRFIRASSTWLRSRAQELPELKDKCRNLISRIGKSRRQSSDYRYDPLSYALNFDEGSDESLEDEFRFRNFSARLPASPPPTSAVKISHEITFLASS
ncbi:hypothetical protein AAC387_Pa04g1154 [Persea americana]